MAIANSHSLDVPSTSFNATAKMLNAAANVMRDPLGASPDQFMTRTEQIVALSEFLLHGADGEFDARDVAYLERVRAAAGADAPEELAFRAPLPPYTTEES